jgi:hypothetical protein
MPSLGVPYDDKASVSEGSDARRKRETDLVRIDLKHATDAFCRLTEALSIDLRPLPTTCPSNYKAARDGGGTLIQLRTCTFVLTRNSLPSRSPAALYRCAEMFGWGLRPPCALAHVMIIRILRRARPTTHAQWALSFLECKVVEGGRT